MMTTECARQILAKTRQLSALRAMVRNGALTEIEGKCLISEVENQIVLLRQTAERQQSLPLNTASKK